MPKEPNYESEIRQRITKRYDNRAEFYGHLVAFVIFNGIMWGVLHPTDFGHTLAVLISAGWGMGLAIHFIQFLMKEARENAIEKAIERERQWRGTYNNTVPEPEMKRKRARLSDLSDDGELIEIVDDDEDVQYKRG
jgi:hypothetical protein